MKVVPRKLCKYTLLKGLTAAPRGRKEAQERLERLSVGSPPESGLQVQVIQGFPEGAIAMGKADLGIATVSASKATRVSAVNIAMGKADLGIATLNSGPSNLQARGIIAMGKADLGIATSGTIEPPSGR